MRFCQTEWTSVPAQRQIPSCAFAYELRQHDAFKHVRPVATVCKHELKIADRSVVFHSM